MFFREIPNSFNNFSQTTKFTDKINQEELGEYTVIVFDCEKHQRFISKEIIDDICLLLETDYRIIVLFYKAGNYDFLNDTDFENRSDSNNNIIYGMYNFTSIDGYINTISSSFSGDDDDLLFGSVINIFPLLSSRQIVFL